MVEEIERPAREQELLEIETILARADQEKYNERRDRIQFLKNRADLERKHSSLEAMEKVFQNIQHARYMYEGLTKREGIILSVHQS